MINMYNSLTKSLNPHIDEDGNLTWQSGWFTNQCCTCGAEFLGGARALECYSCSTDELGLYIMREEERLSSWEDKLNKVLDEYTLKGDYSDEELEALMDKLEYIGEERHEIPEYVKTEKDLL